MIDSESVRWGVPNSDKGIDGHKRIKGIKRHIEVDEDGLPLAIHVTKANLHDSKGAELYLLPGVFLGIFFHLFSHSRKAAPSKMEENTLKIRRPGIKKF
ncbi:MAG: transposase [Muribaculaceae bacterium]|nr:transposase [Muribaculaceae bacterium]